MAGQCGNINNSIGCEPIAINGTSQDFEDDIVISGIAGRFPGSSNIDEFKKNLFEGVDCVTENHGRWPPGCGLPNRLGIIQDISSFDADFFGIEPKKAHVMDPQLRIMLELTQEAIIDAGFNPASFRGSKIGVVVAATRSDSYHYWMNDPDLSDGTILTTTNQSLIAHQILYAFDFKGPSCIIDTACSSSLTAMHQAVVAIRNGDCDAAIICGTNLLLKITHTIQFHQLTVLSKDGKCKTFDADGNGYVRSDGIAIIFLQKSKEARRIYATVVKTKTNSDGYKIHGITFPSGEMQYKLMREVYDETGINPADISYFEAHGTGTKIGDPQETKSITELFCKNRKEPLLIGSVKSNMGHSETASGICAIAKIIIAMESGMIPPNLHYKRPNPEISGLMDGRLHVVDKVTPLKGDLAALNNFGFGGANAHAVFRSNTKPKLLAVSECKLPKLVALSGRTTEAVNYMLDGVRNNQEDDEFIALIRDVHADNIPRHLVRGFEILGSPASREVHSFEDSKRPIWFVFSGLGSQWDGMGKQLLRIETFRRSVERCAATLKPLGVDLTNLILYATHETYENVVNNSIVIAAIQVGLVDLLTLLNINSDGIIGHSAGELACAYADGTLTVEQTMLVAYWRGKSVVNTDLPPGAMAAVGLSWEETTKRCPPDVHPVCNNSADCVTVAGSIEAVNMFVAELQSEGIFAKAIDSSGYAFHSEYIAAISSKLRDSLEKVIPNPEKRSSRWISSSVPKKCWNSPFAQFSSAAYHVNNCLAPVLFYEATSHIPANAIVIEIGPHCLLQAILRRSLPSTVTNIGLQKRDHKDNLSFFLGSIGKLYVAGAQPKISNLYPPVNYPVGRGTPTISSLIKWDHSVKWNIVDFSYLTHSAESFIDVNISTEADAFMVGHMIDGKVLYPGTGYLRQVWKTFAKLNNMDSEKMPVVFENVQFKRATIISKKDSVRFMINIFAQSGDFEICESGSVAVTGRIRRPENIKMERLNLLEPSELDEGSELTKLSTKDIYKEFKLRGYEYSGIFQGIERADILGTVGELKWCNNWIPFIDSMLQLFILSRKSRELYVTNRLQYLSIDPLLHLNLVKKHSGGTIPVHYNKNVKCLISGGIEIRGPETSWIQRRPDIQSQPKHERYTFVPYESNAMSAKNPDEFKLNALSIFLQIVMENVFGSKIKVAEIADDRKADDLLVSCVLKILYSEPAISTVDSQLITTSSNNYDIAFDQTAVQIVILDINKSLDKLDSNLMLVGSILSNKRLNILKNLSASLKNGGFIILEENDEYDMNLLKDTDLKCVAVQRNFGKTYVLLKKFEKRGVPIIIEITEKNFSWLENVKAVLRKVERGHQEILLVNQGEEQFGMIGFMNCLRLENDGTNMRYIFIQDQNAPKFSLAEPFYAEQIDKQIFANVFKEGQWGCYRHLRLKEKEDTLSRPTEHAFINTLVRGDLSSLRWIESPLNIHQSGQHSGTDLCHVYYASLNFKDIMLATGKLPPDALPSDMDFEECLLGFEFSGRESSGRRIMGMVPTKGLATTVLTDPLFTWEVPDNWTLEEAATVPVVYATSYYALIVRGGLQPGERVLIHAGSGGVGQASIRIALHMGCQVFTTVGTQEKRNFLKQTFPQLTDRNIGNSRNTSFEELIMKETNGLGVDVVLNSLAEEKLQASVRCLAINGRFLEIGKYDLAYNNLLETSVFDTKTFHGIFLDGFFDRYTPEKDELVRLVNEGIKNGVIKPLPKTLFSENQIEQAFRYMASGKHIGKVLLKIRDEEAQNVVALPTPKTVLAIPRTYMNPKKSYILVGGLGGFGLELANWIIRRGARHVVLTSRIGIRTGYQALCVQRWQQSGVNVTISTVDCTTLTGAAQLIKESNKIAPVGGIFNLAAVLKDGLFENLNEDNFQTVALPKIDATKNLDAASRKYCPSIDYFVVFSSVSCGRGNIGQTNYGLANSAMERIIEQRKSNDLPGLAIQWGAIGDVGFLIETMEDSDAEVSGSRPQRVNNCLLSLDVLLQQSYPIVSSMVVADKHQTKVNPDSDNIVESISNILGIRDPSTVNPNYSLIQLGMDSLMSSEIKQTLEKNFDIVISLQEIRDLTFLKLLEFTPHEMAV